MKFRNLILTGAAMLMTAPMFASTYYGGFDDTKGGDRDYQDVVFSISGANLTLKSLDGAWYSNPVVNNNGTPFWDNKSLDGTKMNVGYCIYGGGDCGTGLAPGAQYLAGKDDPSKAANAFFTVDGAVNTAITLKIAAKNNLLGYNDSTGDHLLNPTGALGEYTFNPAGGRFGLFATTNANPNDWNGHVYSESYFNGPSQFAFFAPVPEPGTMGAMAGGLILIGSIYRRRKNAEQK